MPNHGKQMTGSQINQQQRGTEKLVTLPVYVLVFSLGIGVFMGALDGSIVNVSIYTMQEYFGVMTSAIEWVVLAYLLVIASFTTIAGKLGDKFSNKIVFQCGMLVFTIGSFLCSISNSLLMLIISRIIQAFGSTGVTANGIAIITRFTTPKNRGTAIGMNSIFVATALTIGPILGGVLTHTLGWQSIFLINIPIGFLGLFWVQKAIPATPPRDTGKEIDYYGVALFGTSLILVVYGLSIFDFSDLFNTILAFLLMIFGILLFSVFYITSRAKKDPIVDITLFHNKTFVIGVVSAILAYGILNMVLFQLPLLVQEVYDFTPDLAGLVLLGIPFAMAFVGPVAGRLSDRYDPKYITTIAFIGLALTILGFILTTTDNFNWFLTIPLTFCMGGVIAFFSSPNGNSIMSSIPKNRLGVAGGFIGIARTFGFSVGISFSTMLMKGFDPIYRNIFGGSNTNAGSIYISSFQSMLFIGFLFALLGGLITFRRPLINRESS